MAYDLEEKTAIVTGGSRGIGLAIAKSLVDNGARVVITGRDQDALQAAVTHLGGPEHVLGVAGPADDTDHQAETVARGIETFGSADLLVNNAAVNRAYGPLLSLDPGAARATVEVNCLGALSWIRQAHVAWMAEHGGAVVNVASAAGLRPTPGIGFYGATKAMLIHLTQQLASELAPTIRVNAVAPAVVKTKFATAMYDGREAEVAATYPLGRLGVPEDIGGAVAFLLSPKASWMTGQVVVIDGGVTLTGGM
jgi:3-oxoacyl-[acyl-carrier protein] reductase